MKTQVQTLKSKQLVSDGEAIRVPLMLMDAVQRAIARELSSTGHLVGHQPGYAPISDQEQQQRQQRQATYDAQISNRWRNAGSQGIIESASPSSPSLADARAQAYARYKQAVSNAWRNK